MTMWCLVVVPSSNVIEVHLSPKAIGQELLEKVCEVLRIRAEMDYLGLRLPSAKGEELWMNLRNPIERQVNGVQPYRFLLKVKFWVPPHLVLQASTRRIMFSQLREDIAEGKMELTEKEQGRLMPLIKDADLLEYREKDQAVYWALKEASHLGGFGEEIYCFKNFKLGIGPNGVNIYQPDRIPIPYSAIKSVIKKRTKFQLVYVGDDHAERTYDIKCCSTSQASGLLRAVTEQHDFYSCDTVRGTVTSQCIRDFKGTIASIFNESTPLGKNYLFDLRLTCREVHDNARRALYTPEDVCGCSQVLSRRNSDNETLKRLLTATTCAVCMDAQMDRAFFPCGHIVCCGICADKLDLCPLCRAPVETSQKIYLPTRDLGFEAISP